MSIADKISKEKLKKLGNFQVWPIKKSLPGITYVKSFYYDEYDPGLDMDRKRLDAVKISGEDNFILEAKNAAGDTSDNLILPVGQDPAFDKRLGEYLLSLAGTNLDPDLPTSPIDIDALSETLSKRDAYRSDETPDHH